MSRPSKSVSVVVVLGARELSEGRLLTATNSNKETKGDCWDAGKGLKIGVLLGLTSGGGSGLKPWEVGIAVRMRC